MNRAELVSRIAQIQLSQDQLKGQFSTLQGHLDEANFWLAKLDQPVDGVEKSEDQVQEVEPAGEESAIEEGNE